LHKSHPEINDVGAGSLIRSLNSLQDHQHFRRIGPEAAEEYASQQGDLVLLVLGIGTLK